MVSTSLNYKGGEFLIKTSSANDVFIPERWSDEQKAIADMCMEFIQAHVTPQLDAIDKMEPANIMETLLDKAGEQGLLGITIPAEYNGFGLDGNTGMLATEVLGRAHSFSVALAAHTGIGTLPILYFGNDAQKQKYLPQLATGELKASYCLTEPGSGSDALGAKTKAVLAEDGTHYVINGQKMWITNAGFADIFIVFAKIDGQHFTAFIIEKDYPGVSLGEEEKKMGIKGSSTRQVFFADVKVPVENVLGEIGKGHLIAFNILNIGRIKLAAATLGAAKMVCSQSVKYATERHQFNRPIASFGAIQHKLAEQAIRTFVLESTLYRTSDYIQSAAHALQSGGATYQAAQMGAAQEYAAECAMLKVLGSETLDYVVDEGVQIFGGYGYSAEYVMDRSYRDSRINRIFEGTNEINRMLTVDYLMKKALKGELDLMSAAKAIQKELLSIPDFSTSSDSTLLEAEHKTIQQFKKAVLMAAGVAIQKYMQKIEDEQEVLMAIADMMLNVYAAESTYLRVAAIAGQFDAQKADLPLTILQVYVSDAADRIAAAGRIIINRVATGDEQRILHSGLRRFTKIQTKDTIALRRKIAAVMINANDYPF